jgi:hypothetical protein
MTIYYVYAYLREDSTPYYIGKGKGDRAYDNSDHKKHGIYLPEDRSRIVILKEELSNQEALDLEARLIKQYGRKDLGTGILYNKTDGGVNPILYGNSNGMTGKKHSEETLAAISSSLKGRKHTKSPCVICAKEYAPQYMSKHISKDHPESTLLEDTRKYKCSICNGLFASEYSLRSHTNRMHIRKKTPLEPISDSCAA